MNNNKIYYVCKYTPIELLAAMGASCENLNGMPGNFELAEQMVHPNICGFESCAGSCYGRTGEGAGSCELLRYHPQCL